ncbi:MAG: 4-hydroxythreonine-4-phosphate dehydrogenase PdxA [Firmicutes bacterium]|nr:4-hydroxythreonine-4-phosphate dehydrogenase PdxA [Bacillota bacterium]
MTRRPRLAITLGDPCGIGPELLVKALPTLESWADLHIFGARAGLQLLASTPSSVLQSVRHDLAWTDPTPDLRMDSLVLGQGSAASGRAAVEAVRAGAQWVMAGCADALVTLPLAKSAAHLAGYDIPGHTEFLQQLSGAPRTRMAFASPTLNVVLHTVHQSLRSVIEQLNAPAVAETLVFTAEAWGRLWERRNLRIALCALNPHAGEEGAFGHEEIHLREALNLAASQSDATFFGPVPADTVFLRALRGEFDVVVALYHDQGLIPMKVLEPARAVNLTLGLPFVRCSPDHGTAFDIAGRGIADPTNFLEAATLALRLASRSSEVPCPPSP